MELKITPHGKSSAFRITSGSSQTARSRHALCIGSVKSPVSYAKVTPVHSGLVPTGQGLRPCSLLIRPLYGLNKIERKE